MFLDCVQFRRMCSWIVYSLDEHVRGLCTASLEEYVRGFCTIWKNVFVDCVQFGRTCSWISVKTLI